MTTFRLGLVVVSLVVIGVATLPMASRGEDRPIPKLARLDWESQMTTYGKSHCAALDRLTGDSALGATYYDMIRVMYQIGDYTGAPSWSTCARRARDVCRDGYVLRNAGEVPGYWNFTTGLRMD